MLRELPATGPADELRRIFDDEIDTASIAAGRGQSIYRSLQKLSQLIGGEYGDRVLYELIQNAHDAQTAANPGRILVRLSIRDASTGTLIVANSGSGFTFENVQAIRNIATSTKEIGEGIGNKGVGFRSVEALTDDVRIYSRLGHAGSGHFDGYCFRFAAGEEVASRARALGHSREASEVVAASMPRYLAAVPTRVVPTAIQQLAQAGYATAVELPLMSVEAVSLAREQFEELISSEAPILLFLDRIGSLAFELEMPEAQRTRTVLQRTKAAREDVEGLGGCWLETVTLEPGARTWQLVRRVVQSPRIVDAVTRSIPQDKLLKQWLDWKGEAIVSLAVPLGDAPLSQGRLYTFLPMAAESVAPLRAHLDAPFYTSIDRRRAKLELPLNAELLDAAAEAAAAAVLHLTTSHPYVDERICVDLAAWQRSDLPRLSKAFSAMGVPWQDAPIWPTIDRKHAAARNLRSWPTGDFKVLAPLQATLTAGATLLSTRLGRERLDSIAALAEGAGLSLKASPTDLALWAEKIAASLPTRIATRRQWTDFYADIAVAFPNQEALKACRGKHLLLGEDEKVYPAAATFYVRQDTGSRGKEGQAAPLPPREIARKVALLAEGVRLAPEAFAAFERAELCKRYNAVEVLRRLPTFFGEKPAPGRRASALTWAFAVWQHETVAAKTALKQAQLHVPCRSGWVSASKASFSEGWSATGGTLALYLAEAANAGDIDAKEALGHLIEPWSNWVGAHRASRTDWMRFLSDAGVTDGFVPVEGDCPNEPRQGGAWAGVLAGIARESEAAWKEEVGRLRTDHPWTDYSREGAVWRLPGQAVVSKLTDESRRGFARLVIRHLNENGSKFLTFRLGRFERLLRDQTVVNVATPLRTLLAKEAWVPVASRSEEGFVSTDRAWLMTDRRNDPRFVSRVIDDISDHLTVDGLAFKTISAAPFAVKLWKDPSAAPARLATLSQVSSELEVHDRAPFRRQYDTAFRDLLDKKANLPVDVPLVLEHASGFSTIKGTSEKPAIFVRTGRDRALSKLLIDTGDPVLLTGEDAQGEAIVALINETGRFHAAPVETSDVRLLVNGVSFGPAPQDSLLVDLAPWLLDAMVVAHELGARELERVILSSTLESQLSRVRVRSCQSIQLQSATGGARSLDRHLARDEASPTLLVVGDVDAGQLRDSASLLGPFLHANLRTFQPMLLRLSVRLPSDMPVDKMLPPSVEDLAFAVESEAQLVEETLQYRLTDRTGQARLILPVAAYLLGPTRALELRDQLLDAHHDRWPQLLLTLGDSAFVAKLVSLTSAKSDLGILRRELGLDYAKFNVALTSVGLASLANVAELQRLFELWKGDLRDGILDRLRRHFHPVWREPTELAKYRELRDLSFLSFNDGWTETRESLDRELVAAESDLKLSQLIGPDQAADLPPLDPLRAANRKTVSKFVEEAIKIVKAAAKQLPESWQGGPSEVAAAADRSGALDFQRISPDEVIPLLQLSGEWPPDMLPTVDLETLGLTDDDLDRESKAAAAAAAEQRRQRDSIVFDGTSFDTSGEDFDQQFAVVAMDRYAASDWRTRSSIRTVPLKDMQQPSKPASGGGGPGSGKRRPRPPENIRLAIGLAGELLAYHYLKSKHRDLFHDACWRSENRRSLFPEDGDSLLGFDFAVNTSETEWLYEVKATPGDACEFELTENEYRTAAASAADKGRRYRILMVQHAFDPSLCRVLELPNPAGSQRGKFRIIGRSSTRMQFEPD